MMLDAGSGVCNWPAVEVAEPGDAPRRVKLQSQRHISRKAVGGAAPSLLRTAARRMA